MMNVNFDVDPDILEVRAGWMAKTPNWHPYRVGVIESTVENAEEHFRLSMAAWAELHARAVG